MRKILRFAPHRIGKGTGVIMPDDHSPAALELQDKIRADAGRLVNLWPSDLEGLKIEADGCFITINRRKEMDW